MLYVPYHWIYIHWYELCMTYDNLIIWVRASETSVLVIPSWWNQIKIQFNGKWHFGASPSSLFHFNLFEQATEYIHKISSHKMLHEILFLLAIENANNFNAIIIKTQLKCQIKNSVISKYFRSFRFTGSIISSLHK